MPVKVLYVATVVKKHIVQFHIPFLKMCKEAGWETAVAARNDYANADDCVIPFCDTYYDIPFERSPLKLKNIAAYRELKKVIAEGGYDIIHCHTPVGALLTRLAARSARKKGTKVFYTAHGFHFYTGAPLLNWLVYYPVERFLARWTDVLITINKEDYARAQKFKAGKVVYVPGVGIDVLKFSEPIAEEQRHEIRAGMGVPDDAVLLCSVGELIQRKNHAIVIRALAQLSNQSIHYCIAGDGENRDQLTALAHELGISERVHLLGYRSDVHELYKVSDLFCLPSFQEGLPVALMEAMASGRPCVASRIRGSMDLLDGQNAMLFDPTNVEECKAKIDRMMAENKDLCKIDYSSALLPFSQDAVLAQMEEIYGIIESPICPCV